MADKERRIEQYIRAIIAAQGGTSPLPEYPAEPSWRVEEMLAAILSALKGDDPVIPCPDPVWVSPEGFLRAIYDTITGASPAWPCPSPTCRIEEYLAAICAGDDCELTPVWDYPEALLADWATAAAEVLAENKIPSAELPENPTEDGTYVLAATVADGSTTLSWESAGE